MKKKSRIEKFLDKNPVSVLGVITAIVGICSNNDKHGLSSDNTTKNRIISKNSKDKL